MNPNIFIYYHTFKKIRVQPYLQNLFVLNHTLKIYLYFTLPSKYSCVLNKPYRPIKLHKTLPSKNDRIKPYFQNILVSFSIFLYLNSHCFMVQ